ncbi:hypothetical protein IQ269_08620 [Tychonema sp. LEGE 07199]|nr:MULTISPECIES: hypothetical protein [unclassified Tychonema]MBE9120880.1 hypothetical protein [Tychonema sp. LEGE 07199]MBE9134029.1 hypothetical protein [Tychonema sp. LEGE 07196]
MTIFTLRSIERQARRRWDENWKNGCACDRVERLQWAQRNYDPVQRPIIP